MIAVKQTRNNGEFHDFGKEEMPAREAALILMLCEVGWGGRIEEQTDGHIHVRTNVMGCLDDTYFTGPADEMAVLHNCLEAYHTCRQDRRIHEAGIARATRLSGGNPGVLSICPELLAFGRLSKVAYLIGIGITEAADIKAAMSVDEDDFRPLLDLHFEENVPLAEIVG